MNHCKHILVTLLVFLSLFLAAGCGTISAAETTTGKGADLVVSSDLVGFEEVASFVDDDVTYIYYRCRTTNVIYVWRRNSSMGGYSYGGFAAMLDPATNGPLTYDKWLTYLETKAADNQNS